MCGPVPLHVVCISVDSESLGVAMHVSDSMTISGELMTDSSNLASDSAN